MKTHRQLIRRDLCGIVGERAAKLSDRQAARAWRNLAKELEALCEKDIPKFRDLLSAVRRSTIQGRGER